jgi:hypothetical protein
LRALPRPQRHAVSRSLCGRRGTEAIALSSFSSRDEANVFAHELGRSLKLSARDDVGTEPDAD